VKTLAWKRGIPVALAVLLGGCFQQAGQSLQSTGSTAEPIQPTSPALTIEAVEPFPSETPADSPVVVITAARTFSGPTTATLPPITIIVQPTATPVRPTSTSTTTALSEPSPTPRTFITPGIPLGPAVETEAFAATAENVSSNSQITALTPAAQGSGPDAACVYTVRSGDTLYQIALRNNTNVNTLRELNPELTGDNPIIQPGQELILPSCPTATPVGEIDSADTEPTMVMMTATPGAPILTPVGSPAPISGETYTVRPGDTLFTIAQRFGTTVSALVQANNLSNPDRLSIGQQLIIPQR
jgi:LysM repeat protein